MAPVLMPIRFYRTEELIIIFSCGFHSVLSWDVRYTHDGLHKTHQLYLCAIEAAKLLAQLFYERLRLSLSPL